MPTAFNKLNIATMITQRFFLMNPITLWILHEVREIFRRKIFRRKRRPPLTLEPSKNQAAAPSGNIKHAIEAE
jgi:hypothetical protein